MGTVFTGITIFCLENEDLAILGTKERHIYNPIYILCPYQKHEAP